MTLLKRWLGPALLAILAMVAYQWLIAPVVSDLREDWAFLHQAKDAAIRQIQQSRQAPAK